MSDVLYPLGLIESVETEFFARVLRDEFESGDTASRRPWADKFLKRRLKLTHTPLTAAEFRWLKSFYAQRSGGYDYFWFRDNLNRTGNVKARFLDVLPVNRAAAELNHAIVSLEEVAPVRMLPEYDEVVTAAGSAPIFWWDANREFYTSHLGTITKEASTWDASAETYRGVWQSGTALDLGNVLGQWQYYNFTGAQWAETSDNLTVLTGTQPACTLFLIAKHPTSATNQTLLEVGTHGAAAGLRLVLQNNNYYGQWAGHASGGGAAANSPQNTWRSICATWTASANTSAFWVDGADAMSGASDARSYSVGKARMGATGTPDEILATGACQNHLMCWAATLTQAQVKAVHNLFAHQYGMALV